MKFALAFGLALTSLFSSQAFADALLENQVVVQQQNNNIWNTISEVTGEKPKTGMKGEYVDADARITCNRDKYCIVTIMGKATREPSATAPKVPAAAKTKKP